MTAKVKKPLHLKDGDVFVTAYAQPASGPGWGNSPLWVVIRTRDGRLREECLQPEDQPAPIRQIYSIAAEVQRMMERQLG
jgi:hypothetical protein